MHTDLWRIKSICVDGLLHSHNLYWQLYPKVNILGGPNGSGKSTLLCAIAFLLQTVCEIFSNKEELRIHSEILFDSLLIEFTSDLSIKVNLTPTVNLLTESRPVVRLSKVHFDTDNLSKKEQLADKITEEFLINGSPILPQEIERDELAKHIIYINSFEQTINTISRLVEKSDTGNRSAKTILDLMLEQALNTRNQLFAQRMSRAMQSGEEVEILNLRSLFSRFEIAVKEFMPEYIVLDTSTLLFAPVNNPEIKISYLHLSTGEKQLLYLLLTVCNTLGESTILLLDEADMGMHIDWKKILLRELLNVNPNMQIIAATHSPALIDGWYANVREISQLYTTAKE